MRAKILLTALVLAALIAGCQQKEAPCREVCERLGTANPAAVYCEALGYEYKTVNESGERGVCVFPDGSECGAWEFLSGKCGQKWSYCARKGGEIKVDGSCSISQVCAVCVLPGGKECLEWDFCSGSCL